MEAPASSPSPSPEQPLLRAPSPPTNPRAGASSGSPASPSPPAARPSRLAALIGRAAGRRGPSMLVRETAVLQLQQRRADWAHSRPVVALDIAWNVAFAAAAAAVLASSAQESPVRPLRLWLVGYAAQCLVHVALVCSDTRRGHPTARGSASDIESAGAGSDSSDADGEDDEGTEERSSYTSRCESMNTMISFLWWVIGFYWIVSGGEVLELGAPRLYWLTVVFLAFDVFFAVFCVVVACFIGIALCCCLPCVIAILYALAGQEGASDADIAVLPRYRYSDPSENAEKGADEGLMIPILNNSSTSTSERILLREDAVRILFHAISKFF
ncbi:hypothetical protein PVAP13_1NG414600 [Panicum virgatum]|uniref:RING-type E3 ubiquitin transferase n=1 Tax=Panicum virgatum TaxID=38727 RepID=A0A8T0X4R3_PANVG|nr:hypothetical protein PVAP13_1NG414600 [Panicum virgatum]